MLSLRSRCLARLSALSFWVRLRMLKGEVVVGDIVLRLWALAGFNWGLARGLKVFFTLCTIVCFVAFSL